VIDNQNLNRLFLRLQLQPNLLLNGGENRWAGSVLSSRVRRPIEHDLEGSLQAGFIEYRAIQPARDKFRQPVERCFCLDVNARPIGVGGDPAPDSAGLSFGPFLAAINAYTGVGRVSR
jgi:hypothetical protein